MSKTLKNTVYYTVGNFTSKAINFLLLPLYTNYLSPEEFGIVESMQVFSNVLIIFFTLGLERAIYRLYFDYKSEKSRKDFLGTISVSIIFVSTVVCGILFILNNPIGRIFKSIDFFPYYAYAILTALFMTYELVPKIGLQVKEQANKYLILSIVVLSFRVLPVIWQVVYLKSGAIGMLKGAMIGNALALIVLIPFTLKQININFNISVLKTTLKYSLPLIPMIISAWIINMSDRIFIERYFSTYDVGIYSLGYKLGQIVQFLSVSILMAYNPYFYRLANSENQDLAKKNLYKTNNVSVTFMLFIGFIVAFFSKEIIVLFFNESYLEAYKIIPIIALGYFFMQLISLQSLSFYQEKKTIVIMNITMIAAGLNILLNFLFISKYSFYGASIATAITQFIFLLIIYTYSKKYYFIPYNLKLLVPTVIVLIFITALSLMLPVNSLSISIKIIVLLACLGILIFKFKGPLLELVKRG